MEEVEIREATSDDEDFLREMAARFGRADDGRLFERFGDEYGDFGFVATVEGEPIGAAWCRRAFTPRVGGEDYGPRPSASMREPFLAVRKENEGYFVGRRLLDSLVDRARQESGVDILVAYPANDRSREMLAHREFREQSGRHVLFVGRRPMTSQ